MLCYVMLCYVMLNLKQGKADMKPNIAAKPKNNALTLHEI